MKLLIVTDAWEPQINGVVRTLKKTKEILEATGMKVSMLTPCGLRTVSCPTYSEIQLTLAPFREVSERIEEFQPDFIHISTEGPLGWAARKYCRMRGLNFTSSFHTRFAEYIHARARIPISVTYKLLRHFHSIANRTMVTTPSMQLRLENFGFHNLKRWSRGVDTDHFRPFNKAKNLPVPRLLYVGRVAIEKNLEAFLKVPIASEKVVVGGGPQLESLKSKYPKVQFKGPKFGDELVEYYSSADAFVFPSQTDTFGLVMLEALACGTPVAAYPTEGPVDVIRNPEVGCLDNNLQKAISAALKLSRQKCRSYALQFSWEKSVKQFESHLVSA